MMGTNGCLAVARGRYRDGGTVSWRPPEVLVQGLDEGMKDLITLPRLIGFDSGGGGDGELCQDCREVSVGPIFRKCCRVVDDRARRRWRFDEMGGAVVDIAAAEFIVELDGQSFPSDLLDRGGTSAVFGGSVYFNLVSNGEGSGGWRHRSISDVLCYHRCKKRNEGSHVCERSPSPHAHARGPDK
jgi:hypothetical protein